MSKNLQCLFGLNWKAGKKQYDFEEEKEKTRDDAIPESVSKLNKIVSYDDTDSDS